MAMTDGTRRTINVVVLVIAVALTVLNLVDLLRGNGSWAVWVGMICWPFVAVCTAYELATRKRLHV